MKSKACIKLKCTLQHFQSDSNLLGKKQTYPTFFAKSMHENKQLDFMFLTGTTLSESVILTHSIPSLG